MCLPVRLTLSLIGVRLFSTHAPLIQEQTHFDSQSPVLHKEKARLKLQDDQILCPQTVSPFGTVILAYQGVNPYSLNADTGSHAQPTTSPQSAYAKAAQSKALQPTQASVLKSGHVSVKEEGLRSWIWSKKWLLLRDKMLTLHKNEVSKVKAIMTLLID